MPGKDTRIAILEAAETLFAEHGFAAVGLREIARAANVNPSSVNYHFGDKRGCLQAIYSRHVEPMNARRRELMTEAARIADPDERLKALLRAYLLPAFNARDAEAGGGARFTRLRAALNALGDDETRQLIASYFDETSRMLVDLLQQCLPGADRVAIVWRCHFLLGALYYTLVDPDRVTRLSGGAADGGDHARAIDEIVDATFAGLKALATRVAGPAMRS